MNVVGSSATIVAGVRCVGAGRGLLECGEVDERLERRSGLAAGGDGAVELRLVIGAAADQREDLARGRIDRDERHLGLALFLLREQLVHLGDAFVDRLLREPLQVQIERRVDVDRAIALQQPAELFVAPAG